MDDGDCLLEDLAEEMARRWRDGERPRVEEYLALHPRLREQPEAALELLYEEIHQRQEQGQEVEAEELLGRFPQWRRQVQALLECHYLLAPSLAGPNFPSVGESLGEFHLQVELGRGTTSRVYLARQPSLANRPVVLKLGPCGGREHLSLARLQHTHIVPLHSAHDFPTRRLRALCLPYFGGATLDKLLASLHGCPPGQRSGQDLITALFEERSANADCSPKRIADFLSRLSYVQAVCWIASCLCDALHYAHERGLLHLDLKPSNVLLAADGQPMLLDFHLARAPIPAGVAAPAWLGGTPSYMAPEQFAALGAVARRGTMTESIDVEADIYSLGMLIYEMLGGERPGEPAADAAGRVRSLARSLRRRNPRVSVGLADVVARCLRPEPERRYPTAADLAADLRRHFSDLPLRGVPNRAWSERWRKWRRRRPYALPILALLLLAVLGGGFAIVHANRQSHKAQIALRDGQDYLDQHRYAEASNAFQYSLALIEDLPFQSILEQQLHDRLRAVEREQAIHELHLFGERVRPLHNLASLSDAEARTVEAHCRAIWQQRGRIVELLQAQPYSVLNRQLRTDLLDVAILTANLQVRLGAGNEKAARSQALTILDEAEDLLGASDELRRARHQHSEAINKQS